MDIFYAHCNLLDEFSVYVGFSLADIKATRLFYLNSGPGLFICSFTSFSEAINIRYVKHIIRIHAFNHCTTGRHGFSTLISTTQRL